MTGQPYTNKEVRNPNDNSAKRTFSWSLTSPVNKSYNCCSGNFSSRSLGGSLCYPGSSCGSSYPSNLVYTRPLLPQHLPAGLLSLQWLSGHLL
ncbi:LOW QUALITY PROTEIN: keratin-associated protein 23-1 [Hipposideros larvatus]